MKKVDYGSSAIPVKAAAGKPAARDRVDEQIKAIREEFEALNDAVRKRERDELDALYNIDEDNLSESLAALLRSFSSGIISLEATTDSLTTRVGTAEGDISTLEQTAASLTTRVTNAEGDITTVSQTADKINWVVASGTSASDMTLTSEAIDLVAQGINISGYVTFSALENAGQSVINGNNILLQSDSTGTSGSFLAFLNEYDHGYGQIWTKDTSGSSNPYKEDVMFTMEAFGGVDNKTCGLMLESGSNVVITGADVNLDAANEIALTCSANPVQIEGTASYSAAGALTGFYVFCDDGIYYNGNKILST